VDSVIIIAGCLQFVKIKNESFFIQGKAKARSHKKWEASLIDTQSKVRILPDDK